MFHAENRQAALEAARRAHHYHFGMMHDYFIMQDKPDVDMTLATPTNMRPPLTYTVRIALPKPPPRSSKEPRTATKLAESLTLSKTEITFTFWLPWIIPLDGEQPVRCTAPDCPLAYLLHYEGVFVVEREHLDAPERSRKNIPPSKIWEAETRVHDGCPTTEDLNVTEAFARYHYWYNRRGQEVSYRSFRNSRH